MSLCNSFPCRVSWSALAQISCCESSMFMVTVLPIFLDQVRPFSESALWADFDSIMYVLFHTLFVIFMSHDSNVLFVASSCTNTVQKLIILKSHEHLLGQLYFAGALVHIEKHMFLLLGAILAGNGMHFSQSLSGPCAWNNGRVNVKLLYLAISCNKNVDLHETISTCNFIHEMVWSKIRNSDVTRVSFL